MDLSIVIVNWNTSELTIACLDSIFQATNSLDYEVIVVDNASIDDSVRSIKALYPCVNLILNQENVGFAMANNQAFRMARGEFILMLNSDTLVHQDALAKCVDFLRSNVTVGSLTPLVLNEDGSIQHPPYFQDPSLLGEISQNSILRKFLRLFPRYEIREYECCNVKHACGCSLFLRRSALNQVGPLDGCLSFSFEDVDICLRMRNCGWDVIYYPDARITHFGGKSRANNPEIIKKMMLSKYHFFQKHHGVLYRNAVYFTTIINVLTSILIYFTLTIFGGLRYRQSSDLLFLKNILFWHFRGSK